MSDSIRTQTVIEGTRIGSFAMLMTVSFYLDLYWMIWTGMFPSLPLWSPHGAVMTLIVTAAALVLGGAYCLRMFNRT